MGEITFHNRILWLLCRPYVFWASVGAEALEIYAWSRGVMHCEYMPAQEAAGESHMHWLAPWIVVLSSTALKLTFG